MKRILITEAQLRNMVNEGVSSVLYHFTTPRKAFLIVQRNELYMQSKLHVNTDGREREGYSDKHFFACFTRNRSTRQGYGHNWQKSVVRFQVDGDMLNRRYKGFPIAFFNKAKDYVNTPSDYNPFVFKDRRWQIEVENEDRVVSDDSKIDNFNKYIVRADVFVQRSPAGVVNQDEAYYVSQLKGMLGDRVFIYDDKNQFDHQTDKTIELPMEGDYTPEETIPQETEDNLRNMLFRLAESYLVGYMGIPNNDSDTLLSNVKEWFAKYGMPYAEEVTEDIMTKDPRLWNLLNISHEISRYLAPLQKASTPTTNRASKMVSDTVRGLGCSSLQQYQTLIEEKMEAEGRGVKKQNPLLFSCI